MTNLCLLPEYENRSKGKKTIYEDTEYLTKSKLDIVTVEKNYTFTESGDLDWLEDNKLTVDEFKAAYFRFIQKRFDTMKTIVLNHFNKI